MPSWIPCLINWAAARVRSGVTRLADPIWSSGPFRRCAFGPTQARHADKRGGQDSCFHSFHLLKSLAHQAFGRSPGFGPFLAEVPFAPQDDKAPGHHKACTNEGGRSGHFSEDHVADQGGKDR